MSGIWKRFCWEDKFFLFYLAIAFFVFLYHLGLMPLLDDEPTRALVSLEMVLSGNYVVPTTHGLLYQNKPPLFNWFIAGLMQAFPHFNELTLRLPSMLVILVTSCVLYLFFRKELNAKTALLVSLAYLSCGRILFYDSMLGYIDPFFTLVLLLDMIVLYQLNKQKNPLWLFIASYLLCAVAYMLKGLPAILYQGITLFVALSISKKIPLLFSWKHFVAVFVFLASLALYYFIYAAQQDVSGLFATLWQQSSKRTVSEFTWAESLGYIATFPFQFVMHFLPWTLFSFVLFYKNAVSYIKGNPLLLFLGVSFLANISVYWISPETKPRYLFVFLPPFFAVTFELFFKLSSSAAVKIVNRAAIVLASLCAVAVLVPLFVPLLEQMDLSLTVCLVSMVIILLLVDLMYQKPQRSLAMFALVLLSVRLVFNHFILPARKQEAPESEYKSVGMKIGMLSKDVPIHLTPHTLIDHDLAYYISSTNRKILGYDSSSIREGTYYICSKEALHEAGLSSEMEFRTNFQQATLYLARKR